MPRQKIKLKSSKTFHDQSNLNNNNHSQQQTGIFNDIDSDNYMKVLKDLVKILQKEKHELIQKYEQSQQELADSKSDLRLLREQLVRQRIGSLNEGLISSPSMHKINKNTSSITISSESFEKNTTTSSSRVESLIKDIELLREQKTQLEYDLKISLCQKEELEIERDTFKEKYKKLNEFLISTSTSQSDETDLLDDLTNSNSTNKVLCKVQLSLNIDELMSQNKYLSESNKNLKDELDMLKSTMKKLKQSNKQDDNLTLSKTSTNTSLLLNKKKILQTLARTDVILNQLQNSETSSAANHQMIDLMQELKSVIESLLESLNDKITANLHQRKVNKMLANRIQDLEKEIMNYLAPNRRQQQHVHKIKSFDELDDDLDDNLDNAAVPTTSATLRENDFREVDLKLTSLNDSISLIRFEDDNINKL